MKAMLLAAGRGERMKNLTQDTPKPLLEINNKPLIQHHIENLSACGIKEFVVNLWYLGDKIKEYLGDGSNFGVKISYSPEEHLLGMGGGVLHALPLLGDEPFLVMSNDVWTEYPFEKLCQRSVNCAHLVLVDNPPFHLEGDYSLENGKILDKIPDGKTYNYGGFGIFHPDIFQGFAPGKFGIMALLQQFVAQGKVTGEHYTGQWLNLNTPDDLIAARELTGE